MNRTFPVVCRRRSVHLIAAAAMLGASTAHAAVETYGAASGEGGVGTDHPGFGFFQFDPGMWDTGMDANPRPYGHLPGTGGGEFAFSGSDGAFHMEVHTLLNQGFTGQAGDHAAYFQMNYNPDPPNTTFGTFWFGGVGNNVGPYPKSGGTPVPLNEVLVFADVIAPAGKPMEFRIESEFIAVPGNGFEFPFTGTGTWQTVGGLLSAGTAFGSFDFNDPQIAALVAFGQNGNEITAVDDGLDPGNVPEVIVDNLTMTIAQATWSADASGTWSDNTKWAPIAPDGASATAVFGSAITAPQTVNIDVEHVAGTLRFDNANSYTLDGAAPMTLRRVGGSGAIEVLSGNHTIAVPVQLLSDSSVSVAAGNTLSVKRFNGAGVALTAGTTVRIIPDSTATGTSNVKSLTLAGGTTPTAKLDITNNAFVVDYDTADAEPFDTIKAQVVVAYAGGAWTGNGITSSNANSGQFGVGYAEASSVSPVPAIFGTVDDTAVLLRLTRYGDANLDGLVNLSDFNRLAGNFGSTDAVWSQGDFTYDMIVNLQDFNRLAANFGLTAAPDGPTPEDWAALAAAVPEPAGCALAGALLGTLLARRRRRAL